jgi:predicted GIY-YIG superfamily endonuclease
VGEAIQDELNMKRKTRKDTKDYISTERRKNLFQLLYETIFSGGIALCELNEQMS